MSLEGLPAKRPRAILEELEALAVRARSEAGVLVPSLTVHLSGGQTLVGRFLAFQADPRDGSALLLHSTDTVGRFDAAYVPLESIAALIVHHQPETVAALSSGRIAPLLKDVPGRLVIERRIAELSPALSKLSGATLSLRVDWAALGVSELARAAVSLTVEALPGALEKICADALGREAMAKVSTLEVGVGDSAELVFAGGSLRLCLQRVGEQVFAPSPSELVRLLSAAL